MSCYNIEHRNSKSNFERKGLRMKNVKKLISLLLVFVMLFMTVDTVKASDVNSELKLVTEDISIDFAKRFSSVVSDLDLEAKNPMKFYDSEGQAIGYIVNYYYQDIPYGYIILDNSNEDFISEYSIGENTKNPYEIIVDNSDTIKNTRSLIDNKLYKTQDFTYGLVNNKGKIEDNYGETEPASEVLQPESRSGKKPTWEDVFVSADILYEQYNFISANNLEEFASVSESVVGRQSGHYCCLVSAAYICAMYYGATNWNNLGDEYMELWKLGGAGVDYTQNGIKYGSAPMKQGGDSVVRFCANRGINLKHTYKNSPAFSFFSNCIDSGNISIFHGGINTSQGRSGHSMAAQGYAIVANSKGSRMNILMVADGWKDQVRFLNLNFSYSDTAGSAYS